MKAIVFQMADGRIRIRHPAINTHSLVGGKFIPVPENITEAQALERALSPIPADATHYNIVERSELDSLYNEDRDFREAWVLDAGRVKVDLTKARSIHMDRIRGPRNKKLAEKDLEYMRADEQGDTDKKAKIAKEKQALRDIPQTFNLSKAKTPAELRALWPKDLPRDD